MTEIYITPWKERRNFEEKLSILASTEIKKIKGLVMSWDSDKKFPKINEEFLERLSSDKQNQLQELINSL